MGPVASWGKLISRIAKFLAWQASEEKFISATQQHGAFWDDPRNYLKFLRFVRY